MNIFQEHRNRQIIPRWLPFKYRCFLTPTDSINKDYVNGMISEYELIIKAKKWQEHKKIEYAIDLLSSAHIAKGDLNTTVKEAALYTVKNSNTIVNNVIEIANLILKGFKEISIDHMETINSIKQKIHHLKRETRSNYRDPFIFLDIAFYYTLLAQNDVAEKNVRIALIIGRHNSYVLRAASRFYLHYKNDPEESLHILRNSPLTPKYPELLSSEIAISEAFKLKSPFIGRGKKQLFLVDTHPYLLSELAGTIGTLELSSYSLSNARKAFRIASKCPTENTVAQIKWLGDKVPISFPKIDKFHIKAAFEADSISLYRKEKFKDCLIASKKWLAYQPFSSKAAMWAASIASVALEDFKTSIDILKRAIISSPNSFTLRNNLAYSYASMNKVKEATEEINKIKEKNLTDTDKVVALATLGLINYRKGNTLDGYDLYTKAINKFRQLGDSNLLLIAEIYHLREKINANIDIDRSEIRKVLRKAKKSGIKGHAVLAMFKKLS